jgi:hypothetical protein
MKFESIFNNLHEFRNFPQYQLERRLDIFLIEYIPFVLDKLYQKGDWKLVLPEFPINSHNGFFDQMDYLYCNGKTLLFIELKTDSRSYEVDQENRYKELVRENDWNKLFEFIKEKASSTNHSGKKFKSQLDFLQKHNIDYSNCGMSYLYIAPAKPKRKKKYVNGTLITLEDFASSIENNQDSKALVNLLNSCV